MSRTSTVLPPITGTLGAVDRKDTAGNGVDIAQRKRAPRRPSLPATIRQVERAGKRVDSITMPNGVAVRFANSGKPADQERNEWDDI
jgi:hypothetical protein